MRPDASVSVAQVWCQRQAAGLRRGGRRGVEGTHRV